MEPATTVDFASAARTLTREARRLGLIAPSYRCPPRLVGVDRSIRRHTSGAVVSVRLRRRPRMAVFADMIEGVIVVNRLRPPVADRVRGDLWSAVAPTIASAAPETRAAPDVAPTRAAPAAARRPSASAA